MPNLNLKLHCNPSKTTLHKYKRDVNVNPVNEVS